MPDLITDIETFLSNGMTLPEVYHDTMLDDPDEVLAIYEYAGANSPYPAISANLRTFQLVVRSRSAMNARAKCKEAYDLVSSTEDDGVLNLNGRECVVATMQSPFKLKVDDKDRTYYCFNLVVTTHKEGT
jgi:hypothetical protein